MSNEHRTTGKSRSDETTLDEEPNLTGETAVAEMALRPSLQAAATITEYGKIFGDLHVMAMAKALTDQMDAVGRNSLERGEAMLTAQAHTLDAIFNTFARRAIYAKQAATSDTSLKLALRAQSQCRATWQALANIKNPPVVGYVRQANIAHGPQQVNNAAEPESETSRKREKTELKNELLEKTHDERMDAGAAGTASCDDPEMATVGEIDRAKDSRR